MLIKGGRYKGFERFDQWNGFRATKRDGKDVRGHLGLLAREFGDRQEIDRQQT